MDFLTISNERPFDCWILQWNEASDILLRYLVESLVNKSYMAGLENQIQILARSLIHSDNKPEEPKPRAISIK